jgi:SPP1 gp7 family putative phage head morphogenesis protein
MMHWEIIKEGLISSLKVAPKQIAEYAALTAILASIAGDLNRYAVEVSKRQITKETLIYTNNVLKYINKDIDNYLIRMEKIETIQRQIEAEYRKRIENSANRMTYTRDTFLINETLRQSPDKKYVYRTKEDIKVCSKCRALNGQVFKYGEAMTGINYPPLHLNCRCIVIPYDEWQMR